MRDRLEDLNFADDICLLAQRFRDMEEKLRHIQEEAKVAGFKEMSVNTTVGKKLFIYEKEIEHVDSFTHLGSILSKDGGVDEDVRS
jgi:hypothetical protein